jgi:hypothetical protein
MKKESLLTFIFITLTVLSCEEGDNGKNSSTLIGFEAGTKNSAWVSTKAAPLSELSEPFGIFAYCYQGDWNETLTANFMNGIPVRKDGDFWKTDVSYYWPSENYNMRFFAYYPYGLPQLGISSTTGTPQLSYNVPDDVEEQEDLMTASYASIGEHLSPVDMHFGHSLTAIRFVTGNDMIGCTITKITLKGVYGYGQYKIGNPTWINQGNVKDFSQDLDITLDGTPLTDITNVAQTFMMIPQTLPASAKIEVHLTDAYTSTPRVIEGSIASGVWPLGTPVTYRISSTGISIVPTLIVSRPDDFNYQGGTHTYSVTSYRTISQSGYDTVTQPASWTSEYSTDGGISWSTTRPSWLTEFTENGDGGLTPTTYEATVSPQTGKTHNQILQTATPVSGTYNLSTKGGTTQRNTANCYIINAPGTYSFPLVYGNAIKDGNTNTSSYISTATPTLANPYILQYFVNHTGNAISDPYIYNNEGCVPNNACIVWQDANNLVTDVSLSADNHNVIFTVNATNICQGNCVIAVRDASNIVLWSWHIWVTDYESCKPSNNSTDAYYRDKILTTNTGHSYILMPINIGWIDRDNPTCYAARDVLVRISQNDRKAVPTVIEINQTAYPNSLKGYNTYYQWGRKDPMPTDRNRFYNNTYNYSISNGNVPIEEGIKNPYLFYKSKSRSQGLDDNENDWCLIDYYNLWNTNNEGCEPTTTNIVKTVYDPCPVGYVMPIPDCWNGFTDTGDERFSYDQINSPATAQNDIVNCWFFYCYKMLVAFPKTVDTSGGMIYIQGTGFRKYDSNGTGGTNNVNTSLWSAIPYSRARGFRLYCGKNNNDVNPSSYRSRAYGFPVRGMREQ